MAIEVNSFLSYDLIDRPCTKLNIKQYSILNLLRLLVIVWQKDTKRKHGRALKSKVFDPLFKTATFCFRRHILIVL